MNRRTLSKGFIALLAVFVSACSTPEKANIYPETTFRHLAPVNIDAASLDVQIVYKSPLRSPNVEHLSPTTFPKAIRTWSSQRFTLTGNRADRLVVILDEGSITEKALQVDTGLTGKFKKEQAVEYEAVLEVRVQVVNAEGAVRAEASGRAWRTQTAPEGISDYDRRMLWLTMIENAFNILDKDIVAEIKRVF